MQRLSLLTKISLVGLVVLLISLTQTSFASASLNVWENIGPEGGTINVIVIDPHIPTTLYAGTKEIGRAHV